MANPFCHVELATQNPGGAKEFYGQLFAWKMKDLPIPGMTGGYTLVEVGEGTGGGIMRAEAGAPGGWMAYVLVESVEATIAKARALGATICVEKREVPGWGFMGVFTDPFGATLAVWEPVRK